MSPGNELIPEHTTSPERPKTHFQKVVLGHDARRVDADQMAGYLILRLGGLIDDKTPVEAVRKVSPIDAKDGAVAVLEGLSAKYDANNATTGNFVNDPKTDEPAAWMLSQQLRGVINKQVDRSTQLQIADLANWIRRHEAPAAAQYKQPQAAIPAEIEALHDILYGLKLEYSRPDQLQEMLEAQYQAIQVLFDKERQKQVIEGGNERQLQSIYARQIQLNQEQKVKAERALHERATRLIPGTERRELNTETVHVITTRDGHTIVFFNVEDTDTDQGAIAVAKQAAHNYAGLGSDDIHMVVLFNKETGYEGEALGTKVVIHVPEAAKDRFAYDDDLREAIADRLNFAEAQFGQGFELAEEAGFGGHHGIVSSPQEATGLSPGQVESALIDYADIKRYTLAQFTVEAAQIANLAGSGGRFTVEMPPPTTPYEIAERKMNISLSLDDGTEDRSVSLTEAELIIYKSLLKTDGTPESVAYNKKLLLQKGLFSEPAEAMALRIEKVEQDILHSIERTDGEACLRVLAELGSSDVRRINIATLVRAYNQIAHSPAAISQLYDPADRRYRVTQGQLPEWANDPNPEVYQKALFLFESVHTLLDRDVVDQMRRYAGTVKADDSAKLQFQNEVGNIMLNLLTSETYKRTHTEGPVYDRLLRNVLSYCIDDRINAEVRRQTMQRLVHEYGSDMKNHWNFLVKSNDPALIVANKHYPEVLAPILSDAGIKDLFEPVSGIPDAYIGPPNLDVDEIQASVERQRQELPEGMPPVVNFVVQIGERDIAQALRDGGINRAVTNTDGDITYVHSSGEISSFESTAITPPKLDLDGNNKQHVHLARAVVNQMVKLYEAIQHEPDVKIRIIRGSFAGLVSSEVTKALSTSPRITPDIRSRIVWCDFNGKAYQESAFDLEEYE